MERKLAADKKKMAAQEVMEQGRGSMAGMTPRKTKGKKNIEIDSEYENMMSEQLDTVSDNSPSKLEAFNVN